MSELTIQELEKKVSQLIKADLPAHPAQDLNAALQVAEHVETLGFTFALRDMCPKSMCETRWRATFSSGDMKFMAEDTEAPVAVCTAITKALRSN